MNLLVRKQPSAKWLIVVIVLVMLVAMVGFSVVGMEIVVGSTTGTVSPQIEVVEPEPRNLVGQAFALPAQNLVGQATQDADEITRSCHNAWYQLSSSFRFRSARQNSQPPYVNTNDNHVNTWCQQYFTHRDTLQNTQECASIWSGVQSGVEAQRRSGGLVSQQRNNGGFANFIQQSENLCNPREQQTRCQLANNRIGNYNVRQPGQGAGLLGEHGQTIYSWAARPDYWEQCVPFCEPYLREVDYLEQNCPGTSFPRIFSATRYAYGEYRTFNLDLPVLCRQAESICLQNRQQACVNLRDQWIAKYNLYKQTLIDQSANPNANLQALKNVYCNWYTPEVQNAADANSESTRLIEQNCFPEWNSLQQDPNYPSFCDADYLLQISGTTCRDVANDFEQGYQQREADFSARLQERFDQGKGPDYYSTRSFIAQTKRELCQWWTPSQSGGNANPSTLLVTGGCTSQWESLQTQYKSFCDDNYQAPAEVNPQITYTPQQQCINNHYQESGFPNRNEQCQEGEVKLAGCEYGYDGSNMCDRALRCVNGQFVQMPNPETYARMIASSWPQYQAALSMDPVPMRQAQDAWRAQLMVDDQTVQDQQAVCDDRNSVYQAAVADRTARYATSPPNVREGLIQTANDAQESYYSCLEQLNALQKPPKVCRDFGHLAGTLGDGVTMQIQSLVSRPTDSQIQLSGCPMFYRSLGTLGENGCYDHWQILKVHGENPQGLTRPMSEVFSEAGVDQTTFMNAYNQLKNLCIDNRPFTDAHVAGQQGIVCHTIRNQLLSYEEEILNLNCVPGQPQDAFCPDRQLILDDINADKQTIGDCTGDNIVTEASDLIVFSQPPKPRLMSDEESFGITTDSHSALIDFVKNVGGSLRSVITHQQSVPQTGTDVVFTVTQNNGREYKFDRISNVQIRTPTGQSCFDGVAALQDTPEADALAVNANVPEKRMCIETDEGFVIDLTMRLETNEEPGLVSWKIYRGDLRNVPVTQAPTTPAGPTTGTQAQSTVDLSTHTVPLGPIILSEPDVDFVPQVLSSETSTLTFYYTRFNLQNGAQFSEKISKSLNDATYEDCDFSNQRSIMDLTYYIIYNTGTVYTLPDESVGSFCVNTQGERYIVSASGTDSQVQIAYKRALPFEELQAAQVEAQTSYATATHQDQQVIITNPSVDIQIRRHSSQHQVIITKLEGVAKMRETRNHDYDTVEYNACEISTSQDQLTASISDIVCIETQEGERYVAAVPPTSENGVQLKWRKLVQSTPQTSGTRQVTVASSHANDQTNHQCTSNQCETYVNFDDLTMKNEPYGHAKFRLRIINGNPELRMMTNLNSDAAASQSVVGNMRFGITQGECAGSVPFTESDRRIYPPYGNLKTCARNTLSGDRWEIQVTGLNEENNQVHGAQVRIIPVN